MSRDVEVQRKRGTFSSLRVLGAALAVLIAIVVVVSALGPKEGAAAPGVVVGEVVVGGRSEDDVRQSLTTLAAELEKRELLLVRDGKELSVTLGQLGFALDVDATTAAVLAVGREGGLKGAMQSLNRTRIDVPLVFSLDESAMGELLPSWEHALIEVLPFDGSVELKDGEIVAKPPNRGHKLDGPALKKAIEAQLAWGKTAPITVPVIEVVPPLTAQDVERAADRARAIVQGPITLYYTPTDEEIALARQENEEAAKRRADSEQREKQRLPKKKSRMKRKGRRLVEDKESTKQPSRFPMPEPIEVVFDKEALRTAFRAKRIDDPVPQFVVELDEAEVKKKLAPVVSKLYDAARDARFEISEDGKVTIVPSRPGTRVDPTRLVEALYQATLTAGRRGPLPVDKNAEPKFTTKAAEALGIRGLVSEYATHHSCCQPRVKNIHRICDMLDGAIVKTGETFSVNAAVGPRTLERGFLVAPSIGDGEMTETPGGGVSQFATTLYNALFDGGYVIRERKPHSFYFNRYPMGLEATLSYPSPDLVFFNDTSAAILLRCDYSETHIRVRLFGDNGGRRIDRRVSQPFEYTDPRIEYLANKNREPDDEKVKDAGSHGFSVITTRIITLPDGSRKEEKRTVKYTGKPRLLEVHPCKIPKGEKGHTGEKCPDPPKEEEGGASGG
ncbi:MAG: hypothetical protein HOW73_34130 [Polyangiaceae bacterium]|nr:hypothetical protein [Polyangiaceae bacterium]